MSEIPEEVDVTAVERPGGNVGVASDHENDPEPRQPTQGPAKSCFSPAPRQDRRERDGGQLDREIPGQSDAECRPDVASCWVPSSTLRKPINMASEVTEADT